MEAGLTMLASDDLDIFAEVFVANDFESLESPQNVNNWRGQWQPIGSNLPQSRKWVKVANSGDFCSRNPAEVAISGEPPTLSAEWTEAENSTQPSELGPTIWRRRWSWSSLIITIYDYDYNHDYNRYYDDDCDCNHFVWISFMDFNHYSLGLLLWNLMIVITFLSYFDHF